MQNLLYGVLIAACVYAGFAQFPFWWTVLILGLIALALFFLARPGALALGLRENGMSYLLIMVGSNIGLVAVPVLIGRLIAWIFA